RRFELDVPAESELEKVKKLAHQLDLSIFCGFSFEKEEKPARLPMSKHDVFFDALPVNFNEKDQLLGRDALTPHGDNPLKNPIPLPFLKVMPGVVFGFYFRLQDSKIGSLTITAEHKRRIFGEILCTVGAGAKTNVGYGQFDTNNIADRIQPMNKAAASPKTIGKFESQSPAISQPAAATSTKLKSFPFNKSLNGKNIIGEVQRIVGSEVWFKVLNVEGFEKEISDKNPSASRFEIGKQYELRVNEVSSDKGILKAKISSLKPLN
ncbi:MAG TPA: type III-B CRISPR module RAMP protein Cmr6, partial [Saprospiraceae bacterium]|nr:type III-B CRISPR module RAMP protein Cmr6 [Saprospiraceae bacterium]